ncbi:MAG: hypothetical protein P8104_07435 [Gammaproteobacteria bacterium]
MGFCTVHREDRVSSGWCMVWVLVLTGMLHGCIGDASPDGPIRTDTEQSEEELDSDQGDAELERIDYIHVRGFAPELTGTWVSACFVQPDQTKASLTEFRLYAGQPEGLSEIRFLEFAGGSCQGVSRVVDVETGYLGNSKYEMADTGDWVYRFQLKPKKFVDQKITFSEGRSFFFVPALEQRVMWWTIRAKDFDDYLNQNFQQGDMVLLQPLDEDASGF